MSDDSETVEDTKNGSLAEVTDDSCTVEFIEIVPLDRPSDDYHTSEFIDPVVEVKPEDLQEMKQEPSDENDNADSHCYVKQEPSVENDNVDSHWYVKQETYNEYETKGPCFPVQVNNLYAFYHVMLISQLISLRYMLGLTPTWAIWCNGNAPKLGWNMGGS